MASRYARCHNLSASRFLSRSHPVFIEENDVFPETATQRNIFFKAKKNDTIPGGRSPCIGHVKGLILDLNPDFFYLSNARQPCGKVEPLKCSAGWTVPLVPFRVIQTEPFFRRIGLLFALDVSGHFFRCLI